MATTKRFLVYKLCGDARRPLLETDDQDQAVQEADTLGKICVDRYYVEDRWSNRLYVSTAGCWLNNEDHLMPKPQRSTLGQQLFNLTVALMRGGKS
jgi:hypothetical protein